jgi:hypothetical protein
VTKYIPAFKDVKVGVEKKEADGKTTLELVPAQRPIRRSTLPMIRLGRHGWLSRSRTTVLLVLVSP